VVSKRKSQVTPKKRKAGLPSIKSSGAPGRRAGRPRAAGQKENLVERIRAGVERFILENATMEEFLRTLRSAGEPENLYAHQLTGSVLSRIVKQAITKRTREQRKAGLP
jgi:hypothetical protein